MCEWSCGTSRSLLEPLNSSTTKKSLEGHENTIRACLSINRITRVQTKNKARASNTSGRAGRQNIRSNARARARNSHGEFSPRARHCFLILQHTRDNGVTRCYLRLWKLFQLAEKFKYASIIQELAELGEICYCTGAPRVSLNLGTVWKLLCRKFSIAIIYCDILRPRIGETSILRARYDTTFSARFSCAPF